MGSKHKLNTKSLALAAGSTWALGMFVLGLVWMIWGYWPESNAIIAEWYRGFGPSFGGLVAGVLWGFVDGCIGGLVFGWFYNLFQGK